MEKSVRVRDFAAMQRHGEQRERALRLVQGNFHPGSAAVVDLDAVDGLLEALTLVLAGKLVSVVSAKAASLGHGAGSVMQVVRLGPPPPVAVPGRGRGFVGHEARAAREAAKLVEGEVEGGEAS